MHIYRRAARAAMGAAVERLDWELPMRQFRKLAAILFLFVLLVPLAASAASSKFGGQKLAKAKGAPTSLISRIWARAVGIWTKEGLGIDPHGSPTSAPGTGSQTNEGLGIDPSGSSGV